MRRSWTIGPDIRIDRRPRWPRRAWVIAQLPAIRPLNWRTGHSIKTLIHREGSACHLFPLSRKSRRHSRCQSHTRIRSPAACSPRTARKWSTILRIDRYLRTSTLQHRSRCKSDGTRAQHSNIVRALSGRHCALGSNRRRAPRERPPTSTVAVVMHNRLIAYFFQVSAWAGRAERSKANGNAKYAIGMRTNRYQRRVLVIQRKRRSRCGNSYLCILGRAPRQSHRAHPSDSTCTLQKFPAIHRTQIRCGGAVHQIQPPEWLLRPMTVRPARNSEV